MNVGLGLTLASSVNDLHKAHPIIDYKLLSVSIFDSGVISLW